MLKTSKIRAGLTISGGGRYHSADRSYGIPPASLPPHRGRPSLPPAG